MCSLQEYVKYNVRSFLKWVLRKKTGLHELQRICYDKENGAPRILEIEHCLNFSRSYQIQLFVTVLNNISDRQLFFGANEIEFLQGATKTVLFVKNINPENNIQFVTSFIICIEQIWGYRQLVAAVDTLRCVKCDLENLKNKKKLQELWDVLMPNTALYTTEQWQSIGLQGEDSEMYFREMGLLGLENLLFFSKEFKGLILQVLSHARHPTNGYPFVTVASNISQIAWLLLKEGNAKTYFFNTCSGLLNICHFHRFYCYLFAEFDRFWMNSKSNNATQFSDVEQAFQEKIKEKLQDTKNDFKMNILVDVV